MTSSRTTKLRRGLWLLGATPALVAILASLWPLEPIMLGLICAVLGIFTISGYSDLRTVRRWFAGVTILAVLISVPTSHWPLRAAYTFSRSSFDRAAEQVRAGEPPRTPCRIGCFRIRKAEIYHNGVVCLWTDDDPSGPTGFVQTGPTNPPFNLNSHVALDDAWQFISED